MRAESTNSSQWKSLKCRAKLLSNEPSPKQNNRRDEKHKPRGERKTAIAQQSTADVEQIT